MRKFLFFVELGLLLFGILINVGHSASATIRLEREMVRERIDLPGGVRGDAVLKEKALAAAAAAKKRAQTGLSRELIGNLDKVLAGLESADDVNNLGVLLWLDGKSRASVAVLATAALDLPDDFLPFNNLGGALNSLGDYITALLLLRYAESLAPRNSLVLANMGTAYHGLDQPAEAVKAWERSVAVEPNNVEANFGLGMSHLTAGDRGKAESYLRNSLLGGYTNRAARALDKITRKSKRAPVLAAETGTPDADFNVRLPELPESLRDFAKSWKFYKDEGERIRTQGLDLLNRRMELEKKLFEEQKYLEQTPEEGVYPLSSRKGELGVAEAHRHWEFCEDLNRAFVTYFKDVLDRKIQYDRENDRITEAEEAECRKLKDSRARERCLDEVQRRYCGRFYAYADPLYKEFHDRYGQFAGQWQAEANLFFAEVAHWAGSLPEAAAAYEKCYAQYVILMAYMALHRPWLEGAANALGSGRSCESSEVPPPPTGEFRASDFETPCSFQGIEIGLGPAWIKVDCRKVAIEGTLGFMAGGVEWDFVDKQATLYLGVGVSSRWPGGIKEHAKANVGVYICVDKDNTIVDIGIGANARAGVAFGVPEAKKDIAGGTIKTRFGFIAGAVF